MFGFPITLTISRKIGIFVWFAFGVFQVNIFIGPTFRRARVSVVEISGALCTQLHNFPGILNGKRVYLFELPMKIYILNCLFREWLIGYHTWFNHCSSVAWMVRCFWLHWQFCSPIMFCFCSRLVRWRTKRNPPRRPLHRDGRTIAMEMERHKL